MDETWGHFPKWNKSDRKILICESKKKKQKPTPININNILVVARGGWGGGPIGEDDQKVQNTA